jgi:phenylacetate-CoA ligase
LKLTKSLYDALPLWAQTMAVNAASLANFRQRYNAVFFAALEELAANERKPLAQLEAEQEARLRDLLRYAVRHVPYYRQRRLDPERFEDWPIIDKQTVAAAPEQFMSDEFAPSRLLTLQTSGTTGTPLTVRFRPATLNREMAFRWRHRAWGGVPFLSRSAYLSGHPVVPAHQMTPPFWRVDTVERRLLCSSYHFAPRNLPAYVEALVAFAPDFLHGYPSSLYVLAEYVLAQRVRNLRPRAVFTASETLLEFQRDVIERAFAAPVYNWYGTTEMTCNIVECAYGSLHYRTDYGRLELRDGGEMVATGLFNPAMPLIRYRTGDVAVPRPGRCDCGCEFPLIERIEGRIEDYIRTPDGRRIGRLDHIFKGCRHVREAQLVQRDPSELCLRIVRAPGYSSDDEQFILAQARQRLGDAIRLRCEYVAAIERTAAGKFRFVVTEER